MNLKDVITYPSHTLVGFVKHHEGLAWMSNYMTEENGRNYLSMP